MGEQALAHCVYRRLTEDQQQSPGQASTANAAMVVANAGTAALGRHAWERARAKEGRQKDTQLLEKDYVSV